MAKWVFHNNGFLEEEKALIHFKDLSFQRGYGVFDFLRLSGNKPLFLANHLHRFFSSAQAMHLPVPLGRAELEMAILSLIQKNDLPGSGVRISLSGGYSEDGYTIGKPALVISQQSISLPTEAQVQQGIRLLSYTYQRPLPQIKSIDYQVAVWLQPERIRAGADDILYAQNGWISECPRSNFFIVTNENKLVTPSTNALAGITRSKVLAIANEFLTVEERPVSLEELKTAKEAFITSTTKLLLPVAAMDENIFPQRTITFDLLERFKAVCAAVALT
ncbi:MAG: amino acid aminotransferase [Chitinophagaceae bacterium]|nr:MAG: amino acid aminotransferase [Chitinophagaceae bacterium]